MRVVVLTPYLPHREVGHGGGAAVRDLVSHLARLHTVRLISLVRPGEGRRLDDVRALGVDLAPIPFADRTVSRRAWAGFAADRLGAALRAWRSGYPVYAEKYWSRELSRQVQAAVADFAPDAVQVEYLQLALLVRDLRASRNFRSGSKGRPLLVLDTHEIGSVPRRRRAAGARGCARRRLEVEARRWERLELAATGWADVTLCVTDADRRRLETLGGENVVTVPLGMDIERIVPHHSAGSGRRFLFLGSFAHRPNRVAAELLVADIWPRVAAELPEAELVLAGRGSRRFLAGLSDDRRRRAPRVRALGFVEDLAGLCGGSLALVAPLHEGGGIKIKVLEAMAQGLPVVTTTIGAEGIADPADDAAWILPWSTGAPGETDAASFADAMREVWRDPREARRRADNARRLVEERFSWSAIVRALTGIYEQGPAAAQPRG
ncbi:MAG: glycosyltransferase family 4 protein [Candidatus Krumholzibacteriia bacterium]